ncbi:hypothetical protein B0H10DRAFT_2047514, partial [Mycena sp. CBHHK59/15]
MSGSDIFGRCLISGSWTSIMSGDGSADDGRHLLSSPPGAIQHTAYILFTLQ